MTGLLLSLISNIFKALVGFCLAEACVDLAIAAVDKEQKYYEIAVDYSVQDQNKVLFLMGLLLSLISNLFSCFTLRKPV